MESSLHIKFDITFDNNCINLQNKWWKNEYGINLNFVISSFHLMEQFIFYIRLYAICSAEINTIKPVHTRMLHTEFFFLNLLKSNQIGIVLILFRLIWYQTKFRLVQNQTENVKKQSEKNNNQNNLTFSHIYIYREKI